MDDDMSAEPYAIPDNMVIICIKRGMAVKIYLPSTFTFPHCNVKNQYEKDDRFYIFQKRYDENNVSIYHHTDPQTNIKHVRKKHAPLKKGIQCVQYGPLSFDDEFEILGKTITVSELKWFIKQSIRNEALPYIKSYADNSREAHATRLAGIRKIIEKMWRMPIRNIS